MSKSSSTPVIDKSLKLNVVIDDMLAISEFAYNFRDVRDVVRDHGATVGDGRGCKSGKGTDHGDADEELEAAEAAKSWLPWPFASSVEKVKRVKFVRPELIITDTGDINKKNENRNFTHIVTPDAIAEFMKLNRKFFKETDGAIGFDEDEKEGKDALGFETKLEDDCNIKILDFDDSFSTDVGGLVYGLIVNVTHQWVCVCFRGTIGATDINTDRNFVLNHDPYVKCTTDDLKPGTHSGFTDYLFKQRDCDSMERPIIDRIFASVDDAFATNSDITSEYKLYTTGHSLGGGLANLFAFHVAHKKENKDDAVKHFPNTVTAMTFAAPVIGNHDFNKEYQSLEKKGFLRHVRISNEGDVVPTNNIPFPISMGIKGDTTNFTQNGVNLFLLPDGKKMVTGYRNTKTAGSQMQLNVKNTLNNHLFPMYVERVNMEANKVVYEQTIEELYKENAGDFTN